MKKTVVLMMTLLLLGTGRNSLIMIQPQTVYAAEQKNGWDAERKHYYVDGKMVKNRFYMIGSYRYFFDSKGKVKTGIAVIGQKFYRFTSTGKLNETGTKKIRSVAKYEKNFASLRKILGKPKKSAYMAGCYGPGEDGILTYDGFIVYTYRENGKEIYMGAQQK